MIRRKWRALVAMPLAVAAIAVLGAALFAQGGSSEIVIIRPDQMKFVPGAAGVTIGASNTVLSGPLDKPVPYVLRVRLAPGGQVSPHTHPDTRYVTVMSGDYRAGAGPTVDPSKETGLPPGSFFIIPAGVPHYSIARNGEAVYQEYGVGPTATNFIQK